MNTQEPVIYHHVVQGKVWSQIWPYVLPMVIMAGLGIATGQGFFILLVLFFVLGAALNYKLSARVYYDLTPSQLTVMQGVSMYTKRVAVQDILGVSVGRLPDWALYMRGFPNRSLKDGKLVITNGVKETVDFTLTNSPVLRVSMEDPNAFFMALQSIRPDLFQG